MQPYQFLPDYVDIHPSQILASFNSEKTFNEFIYRTKELSDLKLEAVESSLPEGEVAYKHQQIIARFLSSNSLYDELFLFHSPGTGKTCSSIHTIESVIRNPAINITKALILVKNEDLLDQFRTSIVDVCTPKDTYDRNNMRKVYSLNTFEKFFNTYKDSAQIASNKYSNHVIVIDEVHNLTSSQMYPFYFNFLHSLTNRKIIVMTGTPMTNTYEEIFPIMNLILPFELQIDSNSTELDLISAFQGRVSYLKLKSGIELEFQGKEVRKVYYPLFFTQIGAFQKKVYTEIPSEQRFHIHQIDASLFVYPDGSYGRVGFDRYIQKSEHKLTKKIMYRAKFLDSMRTRTINEKLDFIRMYSCKYASIVKDIIDHPNEKVFVYQSSIRGSGAIILGLCLELLGFSRLSSNTSSKGRRYVVLSQDTETDWSDIQETFNNPLNNDGSLIQVLIGGEKVKEGVTFKHIKRIHIPKAPWHYADLDQILARGARLGAHDDTPVPIKVFLHVMNIGSSSSYYNFDLSTYIAAQKKDDQIKRIEYLIKVNAFDCPLTYERNKSTSSKNKRDCEYMDCLYRCQIPMDDGTIYTDNYMNQYLTTNNYMYEDEIKDKLKNKFKSFKLDVVDSSHDLLYKTLFNMLINNAQLNEGFYIHEKNNTVFLSRKPQIPESRLITYYNTRASIPRIIPQIDESDEYNVVDILNENDYEKRKNLIVNKPLIIQEMFIQESLLNKRIRNRLLRWVLWYYKDYIDVETLTIRLIKPITYDQKRHEWVGLI